MKCDRGQPSCGWCSRNNASCEYKERKKPGLRAGYGRELEQRLDKLEEIIRSHSEILQSSFPGINSSPVSGHNGGNSVSHHQHNASLSSIRGSNSSLPSLPSDHGTPREAGGGPPSIFARTGPDAIRTPQAETALFLQKPSSLEFGMPPPTPGVHDGFHSMSGISPQSHMPPAMPQSAAAQEYYGSGPGAGQSLQSPPTSMTQSQTQSTAENDLPPYDLLYALVDLYFKHVNTWCPILHRKSTLDSLFGPSVTDEEDKIMLHAIVATTLRFSTDSRLTEERRRHYHDVSKQRVLLYGMEHSSVKALQALVILALDLIGSRNGPPGWNIMALITRAVVQLGLAVETNSLTVSPNYTSIYTLRAMILPEPRDFIEEESRRRLFWMIYLLDRYATIATAFEFALDDKEIDRTLPCRDDLWIRNQKVETRWFRADDSRPWDPSPVRRGSTATINGVSMGSEYGEVNNPENMGAFGHYIEVLGILSKIHKFLKQPVDISALSDVETWQMRYKELDSMLTSWKFSLPAEYGNMAKLYQPGPAKMLNCGWVMLHATYHTAVIRLHSSAAYPTARSPIFTPSYSASQRCSGAVDNIHALAEFVLSHQMLAKLGPPFAFTLWVAARVLLVHGCTVEKKLPLSEIKFFVDALKEMGRYWPVATRYCQLLTRVLDEHNEADRQGGGAVPGSVKILADMRRTAFDLDFLISRQPSHGSRAGVGGAGAVGSGGTGLGIGMGSSGGGFQGGSGGTVQGGGAGGWQGRFFQGAGARGETPPASRVTPAENELEYLDVFDFFNVPRLSFGPTAGGNNSENNAIGSVSGEQRGTAAERRDGSSVGSGGGRGSISGQGGGRETTSSTANGSAPKGVVGNGGGGEFNITDFMMDTSRDWLFKQEGPKKYLG